MKNPPEPENLSDLFDLIIYTSLRSGLISQKITDYSEIDSLFHLIEQSLKSNAARIREDRRSEIEYYAREARAYLEERDRRSFVLSMNKIAEIARLSISKK